MQDWKMTDLKPRQVQKVQNLITRQLLNRILACDGQFRYQF